MKTKKIPYYLLLTLLTLGASLIIGFLSFGGMYAILPLLPLAFASFGLSVAYEGEIYLQNIKGAFKKLFKSDYLTRYLADEFLLQHFPDTDDKDCPQFFKDYETQLKLLNKFSHKNLDKESLARKKKIEKTMSDMRKWFALQLYKKPNEADLDTYSKYKIQLQYWLARHGQQEAIEKLASRTTTFKGVRIFSALAGAFMGLGTTYLLVGGFATIPLLASLPFTFLPLAIVPMAIIAGAAYGFLTYNAVTDMINNDTLRKWFFKIKNNFTKENASEHKIRNVFLAITAVSLLALTVALTICTAGTWWTVAKTAQPLFTWMGKMPAFIMGIINPIITGTSTLIFNLQNTSESLEMIDGLTRTKGNIFTKASTSIQNAFHKLKEHENWLQLFNPARILLKLTLTPLRILLFLGHLVSIGVTSDRVPGVPEIVSALLGIISEGFEDAHYFFEQEHVHNHKHTDHYHQTKDLLKEQLQPGEGHTHEVDLPSRVLKVVFSPLYLLAALWDYATSQRNKDGSKHALSFKEAWNKQTGQQPVENVQVTSEEQKLSLDWRVEQADYRIESFKNKHLKGVLVNSKVAQEKEAKLTALQGEVRKNGAQLNPAAQVREAAHDATYQKHRFFNKKTTTTEFLEDLAERVSPAA
ncbi:Uncharacterised protein [Legionella busanensis]|uniref:Uncharacterized protein n=1 Tax=Legionella busanensis TaxID=190655 RepID=A0A378JX52_9GAMM|nr:hypothetical protein [Legionella busanensis]STX52802.1 Uncharacterised protein [Legionella busanensis]